MYNDAAPLQGEVGQRCVPESDRDGFGLSGGSSGLDSEIPAAVWEFTYAGDDEAALLKILF